MVHYWRVRFRFLIVVLDKQLLIENEEIKNPEDTQTKIHIPFETYSIMVTIKEVYNKMEIMKKSISVTIGEEPPNPKPTPNPQPNPIPNPI